MRMKAMIVCLAGSTALAQFHEDHKLVVDDGLDSSRLGWGLDAQGGIVVGGAPGSGTIGKIGLFDGATGELLLEVVKPDPSAINFFGSAVAIDDGVVGVCDFNDGELGFFAGAAYLIDAETGELLHKVHGDDIQELDAFGISIDLDDGVLCVGAPFKRNDDDVEQGAVYLFDIATGEQLDVFVADQVDTRWGHAVKMAGGKLFIGDPFDSTVAEQAGAVHVFDIATGSLLDSFVPVDAGPFHRFGTSISLDGDLMSVGAPLAFDNQGTAYLYDLSTGNLIDQLHPNPEYGDEQWFGQSVAIGGDSLVIGARDAEVESAQPGLAYLFDLGGNGLVGEFLPKIPTDESFFGGSVAIDGGVIAVAANDADDHAGAIYLFHAFSECPEDINGDFSLDVLDFIAFQSLWLAQDAASDCDESGTFDILDFVCYQLRFTDGCD